MASRSPHGDAEQICKPGKSFKRPPKIFPASLSRDVGERRTGRPVRERSLRLSHAGSGRPHFQGEPDALRLDGISARTICGQAPAPVPQHGRPHLLRDPHRAAAPDAGLLQREIDADFAAFVDQYIVDSNSRGQIARRVRDGLKNKTPGAVLPRELRPTVVALARLRRRLKTMDPGGKLAKRLEDQKRRSDPEYRAKENAQQRERRRRGQPERRKTTHRKPTR